MDLIETKFTEKNIDRYSPLKYLAIYCLEPKTDFIYINIICCFR